MSTIKHNEPGPYGSWTVETLYHHLVSLLISYDKLYEQRFIAGEHAVRDALAAADKASTRVELAIEKRFDAVNEFRQTLSDQAITFMTLVEANQRFSVLFDRLSRVETAQAEQTGGVRSVERGAQRNMWIVGLVVSSLLALLAVAMSAVSWFKKL